MPFVDVPDHQALWFRDMNSYGQIFGAFAPGGTSSYGVWTPTLPHGNVGSLVQNQGFDRITAANEYGQFLVSTYFGQPEGFSLFTPSAPNTNTGSLDFIRLLPPMNSLDAVALNNRGAVAFNVTTRSVWPDYNSEFLSYFWKPTPNNSATGQLSPLTLPTGYSRPSISHMNNADEVAGKVLPRGSTEFVPFVMAKGRFFVPQGLPGVGDPFTIRALNDAGQLVVQRYESEGYFLLTPIVNTGVCAVSTLRLQEQIGPAGGRLTVEIRAAPTCQWPPLQAPLG